MSLNFTNIVNEGLLYDFSVFHDVHLWSDHLLRVYHIPSSLLEAGNREIGNTQLPSLSCSILSRRHLCKVQWKTSCVDAHGRCISGASGATSFFNRRKLKRRKSDLPKITQVVRSSVLELGARFAVSQGVLGPFSSPLL